MHPVDSLCCSSCPLPPASPTTSDLPCLRCVPDITPKIKIEIKEVDIENVSSKNFGVLTGSYAPVVLVQSEKVPVRTGFLRFFFLKACYHFRVYSNIWCRKTFHWLI